MVSSGREVVGCESDESGRTGSRRARISPRRSPDVRCRAGYGLTRARARLCVDETPHALAPLASSAVEILRPRGRERKVGTKMPRNAERPWARENEPPSIPSVPAPRRTAEDLRCGRFPDFRPFRSSRVSYLRPLPTRGFRAVDFAAFVPDTVAGAVPALHRTSLHHQRSVAPIARTSESCQEGSSFRCCA